MTGAKRVCYIHVGLHKTGTTAIQHSFRGFQNDDLSYLTLIGTSGRDRTPNHSTPLVIMFSRDAAKALGKDQRRAYAADLRDGGATLRASALRQIESSRKSLVISGEALTSPAADGGMVGAMLQFLAPHFDEINVVCYIREPRALIVSSTQQVLRMRPMPFFVNDRMLAFRSRLAPWIDAVGEANLVLRSYDRARRVAGDVVADFASVVGLASAPTPPSGHRTNESVSAEAMALRNLYLRKLAQPGLSSLRRIATQAALDHVKGFGHRRLTIDEDLLADAVARHRADIDWAENLLGEAFPTYRPPENAHVLTTDAELTAFARAQRMPFLLWSLRHPEIRETPRRLARNIRIHGFS